MSGLIGTGTSLQNSALSGLMTASNLESQRNIANDRIRAAKEANDKQMTGTALAIGAYGAKPAIGTIAGLMKPAASGLTSAATVGTAPGAGMASGAIPTVGGGTMATYTAPSLLTGPGSVSGVTAPATTIAAPSLLTGPGSLAGSGAATGLGATGAGATTAATGAATGLGTGSLVADTGLMAGEAATGLTAPVATTAAAEGAATGAAAAGGEAATAGAASAVPIVGWAAAAGLGIYSLGTMFDWW